MKGAVGRPPGEGVTALPPRTTERLVARAAERAPLSREERAAPAGPGTSTSPARRMAAAHTAPYTGPRRRGAGTGRRHTMGTRPGTARCLCDFDSSGAAVRAAARMLRVQDFPAFGVAPGPALLADLRTRPVHRLRQRCRRRPSRRRGRRPGARPPDGTAR